jgi:ribosomal protein S18 acetylase RimI-like enzyme
LSSTVHFSVRGVGSAVLRRVIQQADNGGAPIRLHVLKTNPAKRLYDRFDFDVVGETTTHY